MEQNQQNESRKKFLFWGAAALSSVTILKFISGTGDKKTETVKMLTRDGKLVEIDKSHLTSTGKKISNEALQEWIKK